jgi:hypothetical protein
MRAIRFLAYLALATTALSAGWFVAAVMLPALHWLWLQAVAALYLGIPIAWFFWAGLVGMFMQVTRMED